MEKLAYACSEHMRGRTTGDLTIGVCWDSDRLYLWRVMRRRKAALLSTPAAKAPRMIALARDLQAEDAPRWKDLAEGYVLSWGSCPAAARAPTRRFIVPLPAPP